MQKILIIGNCGSGKSTLARRLHAITGLELIHLDRHYWRPGWAEPPVEVWRQQVSELVQRPAWIMDGNYSGTHDIRLPAADTVVFLDVPTYLCLWRVLKRVWRNHGKVRPDMPAGCPERFSISFLLYVANFRRTRKRAILAKLKALPGEKEVIVLKRRDQFRAFEDRVAARGD